jgi:hypothetical protein
MGAVSMKTITEKTFIPISLLIVIIGVVVWITTVSGKTDANTKDISDIKIGQQEYNKDLHEINTRLSRIEGKLDKNDPRH